MIHGQFLLLMERIEFIVLQMAEQLYEDTELYHYHIKMVMK